MDVKVIWNNDLSEGDIAFDKDLNDLIHENGIESAIILSLFLDQRAEDDDIIDDTNDKRGWWGDKLETNGDQIGSKLWMMYRASTTKKNITKIKEYIYEALEWMITDGVCSNMIVTLERIENENGDRLYCLIEILKQDGNNIAIQFNDLWTGQFS